MRPYPILLQLACFMLLMLSPFLMRAIGEILR